MALPENPVPRPADLSTRLGELAAAVSSLHDTVEHERRAHKRSMLILTAALLILLSGGVVVFTQTGENQRQNEQLEAASRERARLVDRRAIDACVNGNEARTAIRDSVGSLVDALAAVPSAEPLTPDEQAQRNARIAAFRADVTDRLAALAPHDCSPDALGLRPFNPDDQETDD